MESAVRLCQHPRVMMRSQPPLRRLLACLAPALLAMVTACPAQAVDAPPPIPAPGQSLPAHAAGAWPNSLTDDSKKPGRTPEQQAALDAVTNELKRIAETWGPDAVVLQSKLLIRAMQAGALGATEVKVAGASPVAGPEHLEIDVDTGLFFDGRTSTGQTRSDRVWTEVALPVLDEMKSFRIEPAGLELVLLYNVKDLEPGTVLDATAPSRHEGVRVTLAKATLADMAEDRLAGEAVRGKAAFRDGGVLPAAATAP